jgi:hypothetical protein
MRQLLPSRSAAWWTVVVCSLAAVGVFMVFEVLDLDGSDLPRRIFQPSAVSQSSLAESERAMSHGACDVQGTLSQMRPVLLFQHLPLVFFGRVCISPALPGRRLTGNRPRTGIPRASLHSLSTTEDPSRTSGCVV